MCATDFELGQLLGRANAVDVASGPAAELMTKLANEVAHELGRVVGHLQFAQSRLEAAEAALSARRRNETELLRQTEAFGAPWSAEMQEEVESRLSDLLAQFDTGGDDEPRARLERIEQQLQEARASRLSALAAVESATNDCEALSAIAGDASQDAALRSALAELKTQVSRLTVQIANSRNDVLFATELEVSARGARTAAAETLSAVDANVAEDRQRLAAVGRQLTSIIGSEPFDVFVERRREIVVAISAALERLGVIRDEGQAAMRSRVQDSDLRFLRAEYAADSPPSDDHELRGRIEGAVLKSEAERNALLQLEDRLRSRARLWRQIDQRMRGTALLPWNDLFRSVYSSLAGSLGETLEWTADRVDMRLADPDAHATPSVAGRAIHGWMAGHFFSEGQLAALQISAMITASILLPWSRWTALLLDDPLQHADVIKVGAFADLIRALCQDEGKQIIMTTHDQAQANFIAAKFRAADLPASVIRFERPTAKLVERSDVNRLDIRNG